MPNAPKRQRFSLLARAAGAGLFAALLCSCQPVFTPEQEYATNPCLVLALPASGPYAPIAQKIRSGADTAVKELQKQGTQVRVVNVNTEASDWLTQLAALPEACAVVGGPLRDKAYLEAHKAGVLNQRAFFAFVPTLASGDEGRLAWRYFPSPQDQIDSLIGFATDQMGIRTYGAFYPDDNYGKRMTELMRSSLQKRNIPLQSAAYNPGAPASWTAAVAPLINPRKAEDGRTTIPQTTFEALFVPDSFKNMDRITTSMLINGEDRLALLGTTLWEQGLSGKQVPKAEKYSLAIFPGAWNRAKAPASLKNGDFWSALGYDFINFGAAIALARRLDTQHVTARAQKAATAGRAMAPVRYDDAGVAHQQMYLFQITPGGMTPLDANRFRQARTQAAERAALRMQGIGPIDPETGEAMRQANPGPIIESPQAEQPAAASAPEPATPPLGQASGQEAAPAGAEPAVLRANSHRPEVAQPVQAQPAQPAQRQATPGVMSDVPRSSYKLSLPGKR